MSLSQKILFNMLSRIQYGQIIVCDEKSHHVFKGNLINTLNQTATITVINKQCYKKILFGGSIGAGKSYMDGDWDVDNLSLLIEIFLKNADLFRQLETPFARLINSLRIIVDKFRHNNLKRAKTNILAHYDLGNEFFELFLDKTMMYSCALHDSNEASLEQASLKKLQTICDNLELKTSDHVLEIGTGWGGFAIFAAQNYGCKITTTTISDKQYQYVTQEVKRLGLEKQIQVLNCDYRKLSGQYDKLVSIEMIEAVGYQYFDTFFRQCNHLVKPNGLFFLQAITINDQSYQSAKNEIDFIKKYIFPGGCLPSIQVISQSIATQTKMQLISLRDIGHHYVKTLNNWHMRLNENKEALLNQGFGESFMRMWQFYFCYCAAGFETNHISNIHALWRKRQ